MERISIKQVNNGERFFRVPKQLFESPFYKKMSADSKLLYAILKDRFDLSVKNNWIDEEGNIYFIFTVEEIGEMLGCGKDKVIKLKKELKKYDLLEEVRQGLNKPNLIYLGSLKAEKVSKPLKIAEVGKTDFQNSENQSSRNLKNRSQEVEKSECNDTDISDTDISDTDISDTGYLFEEEEEKGDPVKKEKQEEITRKIDKATKYDKEYIFDLVHSKLEEDQYSPQMVSYIMLPFDKRYQYALENMQYASSSEKIAEYVYNGLLAIYNSQVRKKLE